MRWKAARAEDLPFPPREFQEELRRTIGRMWPNFPTLPKKGMRHGGCPQWQDGFRQCRCGFTLDQSPLMCTGLLSQSLVVDTTARPASR